MSLLKKKSDPYTVRARTLNSQIAALESQIKQLDDQLHRSANQPRLRSTAVPHGATISHHIPTPLPESSASPVPEEPVFESVDRNRLNAVPETFVTAPELYNELGVRKYDLPAMIQRAKTFFSGPNTTNPKLVNYLAAGGVQGLRPLRKEKRVARNRLFGLMALLFFLLLGIVYWFVRNH